MEGHKGPRPVKSREHLWGLLALSAAERGQVALGNALLRTMLRFLVACHVSGTPGLMEHPAEPIWDRNAPSSWLLGETRYVAGLSSAESYVRPVQPRLRVPEAYDPPYGPRAFRRSTHT